MLDLGQPGQRATGRTVRPPAGGTRRGRVRRGQPERNGSNTPTVTYTRGRDLSGSLAGAGGMGGLLARSHGSSGGSWSRPNFHPADGNGNVTALVNSAGALQASYKYDPYGRYLSGSGTLASANVMRFSSKPWVGFAGSDTGGLYYYGYRFYDPYLQRWLNRDSLGDIGFYELSIASRRNLRFKPFDFPRSDRYIRRWDRQIKPLYVFVYSNPIRRIDPLGLDAPGCDGVPGKYESPCVLEACAEHDHCYCVHNCGAFSWLDTFSLCINDCKQCNVAAAGAIIGCGIWDEGYDDPDAPNFYCGQCGVFFDVPNDDLNDPQTNPHFGHTSGPNNNGCQKK